MTLKQDDPLLSDSGQYMITRSTGQTITFANASFARVVGYDMEDIVGSSYMNYVAPSTPQIILDDIFSTLKSGQRWDGILELLCRDESIFWARCSFSPWYEDGVAVGTTTVRTRATTEEIRQAIRLRERVQDRPSLYGVRQGKHCFVGVAAIFNVFRRHDSSTLLMLGTLVPGLLTAAWLLSPARSYFDLRKIGLVTAACSVVAAFLTRIVSSKAFMQPMHHSVNALHLIASGELTHTTPLPAGHAGELQHALGVTRESLISMVMELRSNLSTVAESIVQLSAGNSELAKYISGQAASTAEISASLGALLQSIDNTVRGTQQAKALANNATTTSLHGKAAVTNVVTCMSEIARSAMEMKDVTAAIEAIAAQTNLLALNAAVESARAGEHGRGFGVVAKEVRVLATRAADATARIRDLIGNTLQRVETGQAKVSAAHDAIDELSRAVASVGSLMTEIAAHSEEQNSTLGEIHLAISDIDAGTQHSASMVEQASAATDSLVSQAHGLQMTASIFR